MTELLAVLAKSSASGSKSTVLNPLQWMLVWLGVFLLAAIRLGAPDFVVRTFWIFCIATVALSLVSYAVMLVKNPDYLRTERFTLERLRIENSLRGDTSAGFAEVSAGDTAINGKLIGPAIETQEPESRR